METNKDYLPTVSEYSELLHKAIVRFGITINQARDKYGLYTKQQWTDLFNKPVQYSEHCPNCMSENITMIGDPEFNDEWECDCCKKTFGTFKIKAKE